jgi:predicted acylesterase/phospholipase RssA
MNDAASARGAHTQPTIALALGAGSARGLAHIVVLEAFDELGIKPAVIAGSSMGAVIGAAYAAGVSARQRERQKPGALRRELDCLLAETEASVQHRGPNLEHAMRAAR